MCSCQNQYLHSNQRKVLWSSSTWGSVCFPFKFVFKKKKITLYSIFNFDFRSSVQLQVCVVYPSLQLNDKHSAIVVYFVFKYVKRSLKCPAWRRSSVEFLPQFIFTVPRMHSVSNMFDTARGVCPVLTKQSSLVLLRNLIIGLSLTNQLT